MSDWPFDPCPAANPFGDRPQPAAAGSLPSYALAGWWSRVGAVLLDDLILLVPLIILVVVLGQYHVTHYISSDGTIGTTVSSSGGWADGLLWLLYALFLLIRVGVRNGQTLGKQVTKIRVIRNDGKPVDIGTVIIREGLAKAVIPGVIVAASPSLRVIAGLIGIYVLLDYLWPLWDRENRALHDQLAGTHVVSLGDRQVARFSPSPR
jgi:uncharacterized RDD family membrane protein YckC